MSVEIIQDSIFIDEIFEISAFEDAICIAHDPWSDLQRALLNKQELAQLISALQAMHDKMRD